MKLFITHAFFFISILFINHKAYAGSTFAASLYKASSCNFTIITTTQPAMCTANMGAACVSVTGGSGNYSYLWDVAAGSQTTACANNLVAGTYCVTITDIINVCDSIVCININQSTTSIVATATATSPTCTNTCDATVTVMGFGGTAPHTYSLDNGPYQTNATFTGVCPGTHTAYVKDANGCIGFYSILVSNPSPIVVTTSVTIPPSVAGNCDGELAGNSTGGTGAYTYSWYIAGGNVIGTQPALNNVCDTTYVLCVTDVNGCSGCDTISVSAGNSVYQWSAASFSLYPNPADNEFYIATKLNIQAKIEIWNALGQLKHTFYIQGNQAKINSSAWPTGLYIVKISNNLKSYSTRFIKK
jgi:hypothetical protein